MIEGISAVTLGTHEMPRAVQFYCALGFEVLRGNEQSSFTSFRAGRMPAEMTERRFPPPWTLDEHDECFIVRDANGQALGYFYFDEKQQSPAINRQLTRDDARRMAVNFAKLPDLVASRWLA